MKKYPWLSMRKKTDQEMPDEPPIWFGNWSNGEYFRPATRRDRKIRKYILERADENARRVGVDRRQFLASAMGMCTTLLAITTACSSEDSSAAGSGGSRGGGGSAGGSGGGSVGGAAGSAGSSGAPSICVPIESQYDEALACETVGGDEFIFDVQTHWFKPEDLERFPTFTLFMGSVMEGKTEEAYIEDLFMRSDTTVAVLTSWPGVSCTDDPMFNRPTDECGLPLSNDSMAASREKINQLSCNTRRLLQHVQVMVQDRAGVDPQLEIMERVCDEKGVAGWKMYPGAFPPGYKMTDPDARKAIEKGLELEVPVFAVHKGLPIGPFFATETNYPDDIGPIAKDYPEARFVIYHSGICSGWDDLGTCTPEGPFDPTEERPTGVNALIKSVLDSGIGTNGNVYAEIGSAMDKVWMDDAQATHFFGKLMKYIGPERVVWGTDCVIYGSPAPFIEWFRTFTPRADIVEQHGYPALDAAAKAKIFGLNAAELYGIDPDLTLCQVNSCPSAQLKRDLDAELGPRRWAFQRPRGPKTWEEYQLHGKACYELGRPG